MSNKVKVVLLAVVLLGAAIFLAYQFWFNRKIVPAEFTKARAAGALIAQNIVRLSSESLGQLTEIGERDAGGDYAGAIQLVEREMEQNRLAREEAFKLSRELGRMAGELDGIEPFAARNLATSALGHEVNLINQLIAYNHFLFQLFNLLNQKFSGLAPPNPDGQVKELLKAVNGQTEIINDLNKKFNETMKEFDRL
jgi:hypothetical protein